MKHTRRILSALLAAVMLLSLLPATAFAAAETRSDGATIDVTEYGADPTGVKESSTAVIAALAYAKTLDANEQKTIVFPKGEYHFYADYSEVRELYVSNTLRWDERSYANKYIGILVEGMKNVTIDGGGSLFIFHGNICTMAAIDSENVVFTNFSQDHASPDVVDVTVEAHEGDKAAILYIPPCYTYSISGTTINWRGEAGPVTGQPYWSGSNNLSYQQCLNTITGRSADSGKLPFSNVSSIEQVDGDPTHLKVTYSSAGNRPDVGLCFQMRIPNPRMTPGTFFLNSKNITVSDANFHFLHGFGMVGQLSENITLDTVKYQARPGTGRTSAGFADFVQMSSIAGEVTIRNCEFANPHDDPINVHGTFLQITDINADRTRVVVKYMHGETWGFPQYNVGDTVDFTVKDTLAPVAGLTRTVKSVVNPGEGQNLNGTARSKTNENDMRTIIVELNEALPDSITANNYVMENVTHTPEVLIEGCRFAEVPTRGILVTTRKPVVIRNNYFDRIKSSSIFISCDAQDWRESGRTEDVLITGNTFIAENTTGLGDHYGGTGIIMIWPTNPSDDPNYQIHKNIRIENNTFELLAMPSAKSAIVAKSVNGLTIKNNLFRRYDPMSMTLAASAQSVAVGGSQRTTLTPSGAEISNKLFRLQACKNITFEGNTYDNGLNLSVQLDGSVVTAADVTDEDDVLTIGGDNKLPAVGTVSYFSSDPSVATVDASGVVTGVKAGTAEIYAYTAAGGRVFESNHLTFTVTGEAATPPSKIEVTGADTVAVDGSVTLTANVTGATGNVAWAVKPATVGAVATISPNGVLTATAPGVVEVTATLGGVTASKLVTVNKPNFEYLSDLNWTSATVGDNSHSEPQKDKEWSGGKISLLDSGSQRVEFDKGIGTHANSTITYDLAGKGYTRLTAKVGVSQASDDIVKPRDNPTLRFRVLGNNDAVLYSSANETAKMLKSTPYKEVDVDISAVQTLKLETNGVDNTWSAHGNWADAKLYTNNQAPTASNVAVAQDGNAMKVTYAYNDTDGDAQTGSVIAWYVSDTQDGHYTRLENASSDTLTITAATSGKWVKAVVVPRDATGRCGAPVGSSTAVQAPVLTAVQSDATLRSLSVAGAALSPAFDPSKTQYTIDVPPSADKVTIAAVATQTGATVEGNVGEVELTGAVTTATITVTAPDSTTKTYTVTIQRPKSSVATLSALTATAGSAGITFDPATRFYQLVAAQGTENLALSLTKGDAGATVAVRFNGEEKGPYTSDMSLPLVPGLNSLELRVTAADGSSTAIYRVAVTKPAAADASLKSLSVNGGEDILSSMEDGEKLMRLDSGTVTINAVQNDPKATVLISVDGKKAENNTEITLTETLTTVNVRVVAEDITTEKLYTLVLAKKDPANAELAVFKLDGLTLSPASDPDPDPNVIRYTATSFGRAKAALTAVATQADATVTYETVAEYESGTGEISGDCRFFTDVDPNQVIVTVTSPNRENTKTYIVTVGVVAEAYLSDLLWTSATSDWGSVRKDLEVGGSTSLSLLENGQEVTYEKGLGTHANSTIVYDLSSWGFTRFTAKVGMDHSQAEANKTQRLCFYVNVDGANQYTSGNLGSNTNCETVNIEIPDGSKQLTLYVEYKAANNGNAHADWADAKLSGDIPKLADTILPIQDVEFEHHEHVIYDNAGDPEHTVPLHPIFKPKGVAQSAQISLDWSSEDTSIATVAAGAERTGLVTAVAPGRVEITATATASGGIKDSCFITVKHKVAGTPTVSGELKFGSVLTANISGYEQGARPYLKYQWYRGAEAKDTAAIPNATQSTYTPVKEDIDQVLTVKVSCDPSSYYVDVGDKTYTTGAITKADGDQMPNVELGHVDCTAVGAIDGQITGLCADHVHQYQKWDRDNKCWPADEASWTNVALGVTSITGLAHGSYRVRHAETDTHFAGKPSGGVTISVEGSTEKVLTIPSFTGGVVLADHSQFFEGETVTLVVTPDEDEGYQLVEDSLKATTEGGTELEVTKTNTAGTYTFVMPDADVTVTARFEKKTYTIGHELEHITCDMEEHDHTVTHGVAFTITLTPEDGYDMPRALTLTETETGEGFDDYDYKEDSTDPAKRELIFEHGVTCGITISGEATLKSYTVEYKVTNGLTVSDALTASDAPQKVDHYGALSVKLTADRGHGLPGSIAVTVGGEDFNGFSYDPETGVVEIAANQINGNVVITARGEALGVALQSVSIIGSAQVGRTLSFNTDPVQATVTCQWILVDEAGKETPIDGATGNSYVIPEEAVGKTIRVSVTGTGGYNGTVTSEPTAKVTSQQAGTPPPQDNPVIVAPIPGGDTTPTPTTTTTTTTNPDGSTTTTVTDKETGTITETTEKEDGTVEIKETQKDGTVTETTEKPDGSTEMVETKPDGTVTETTKNTDGSSEVVETKPDGTVTETNTDAEGGKVEKVTDPEKNVAITVTDAEGEVLAQVELPAEVPELETRFEDVPEGHWADQAIHSMAAMEVVKGVGDDRFDMDSSMTRGALATVLSRLSNGQEGLESSFTDVAADEWYADGIAWAARTGIVTGYSETEFGPEDIITREQLAVMLCRYARLLGMDTTADSAELDAFNDGSTTHDWAADSIAWCVANGILRGMGNETLAPTATATRAQVAVMLQRFMDLMK